MPAWAPVLIAFQNYLQDVYYCSYMLSVVTTLGADLAKLAKLPARKLWSRRIWGSLVCYANAQDDRGKAAPQEVRDFQTLISNCMDWIGGVDEDIEGCLDKKEGTSLNDLEARHRADIRRVLTWLSAPNRHVELSARASRFLSVANGVRMDISANGDYKADGDDPLILEWPDACESVISPVCKFILEQIERHDIGGEALSDVIPIGLCERPACNRFFVIKRAGRGRFCSSKCRVGAYQDKLTKAEKAARMRKYRATIKEFRRKPIRFPKRKSGK
jgi:hypothetical protein